MTETQLIPLLFILAVVISNWTMTLIDARRNIRRHRELLTEFDRLKYKIDKKYKTERKDENF